MTMSPVLRLGSRAAAVRELQTLLNRAGARPQLAVDGVFGPATLHAVRTFQTRMGLMVDGVVGAQTWRTLRSAQLPTDAPARPPARPATRSPHFAAVARNMAPQTFGAAGGPRATAGQCLLPFPMPLAWDQSQRISRFRCHELLADVMTWVYAEAAKHYGEVRFRQLRLDLWGGCFNNRNVRGGTIKSIHAYGAAVDTDPEHNGLHTRTAQARLARVEYQPWWSIVEASGALSFGKRHGRDWMHWSYVQE